MDLDCVAYGLAIGGNTVYEFLDRGIHLGSVDGLAVNGNVVYGKLSPSSVHGIWCDGDYCVVNGNVTRGAFSAAAIRLDLNSSQNIVSDNRGAVSNAGASNHVTDNW